MSPLLNLNETALLFIRPQNGHGQVVQVTLQTPSRTASVNEQAVFFLSQHLISDAILRLVQADMILCSSTAQTKDHKGISEKFVLQGKDFSITCHKIPWLHPLKRWTFYCGAKEAKPAIHKWTFDLTLIEG